MKIAFVASEAAPFVKTGGLGDVIGSLPQALSEQGCEISVFLPYYKCVKEKQELCIEYVTDFRFDLAWRFVYAGVFRKQINPHLIFYFIDNEAYFFRDGLYGHPDDGERFAFFSKAVLEAFRHLDYYPQILHLHDWQTALIPFLLKTTNSVYEDMKTVFTIHNIEYQGKTNPDFITQVLGVSEDWYGQLVFDGCVNFMKGGVLFSDRITTVSKTYAHEIQHQYYAHGLQDVLRSHADKLSGIVNGIDIKRFNPRTDPQLAANYNTGEYNVKLKNKLALQQEAGLPQNPDLPMIALVSRLVTHKGLELIERVAHEMAALPLQWVVLGTGDSRFEQLFYNLRDWYPDKIATFITFDPALASRIYAAADFLLMPSKSEPCGLSQLIALRYGTLPIVRETGGLFDTVPALNTETLEGVGFTFKVFNAHDMLDAVRRAIDFYQNRDQFKKAFRNAMKLDHSWKQSAEEYQQLYEMLHNSTEC